MNKPLGIMLTFALALFQPVVLAMVTIVTAGCVGMFLGDNDDGTFTPTAARRWKAALILAISLAIWAGQLYATRQALFKMWRKRPDAAAEKSDRRPTAKPDR